MNKNGNDISRVFDAITSGDYEYARLRCRNEYAVQDYARHCCGVHLDYETAEFISEAATAKLILSRILDKNNDEIFRSALKKICQLAEMRGKNGKD